MTSTQRRPPMFFKPLSRLQVAEKPVETVVDSVAETPALAKVVEDPIEVNDDSNVVRLADEAGNEDVAAGEEAKLAASLETKIANPVEPIERDEGQFPTPPIYFGTVRLHNWQTTAKGGMSLDVGILDTPPTGLHPFKGLYCGKQSGQRLRVWFGNLADEPGEIDGLHQGEALLMRWSDDSINGMNVKMILDDGPDGSRIHPFDGLPTGRSEGEKLEMAVWAISDDETLQDPRQTRKRVPFYELSEVRQAHILSGEPRFVSYLKRHEGRLTRNNPVDIDVTAAPRDYATAVLYRYLKITSRKTLRDENAEGRRAQKLWAALLREYFDDYYNRR